jgi:hypothetical protein
VVPEFADGGVVDGDAMVDFHTDRGSLSESPSQRRSLHAVPPLTTSPSDIVGWRIVCTCVGQASSRAWRSALIARVPTPALSDLAAYRLFVCDEEVSRVENLHAEALEGMWREEHVLNPDVIATVLAARAALDSAVNALDVSVASARRAGATWESIAAAVGMTRDSARIRWSRVEPGRTAMMSPESRDAVNAFYKEVKRARKEYTRDKFDCPTCKAQAQHACTAGSGQRKDEFHAARVKLARASLDWPFPNQEPGRR